ncbi:MAG TPA: AAA family ATPase [Roseiflexaceae bacterium]|nr:AAA family ATPase [Roseiflexaceae bacterium]HMP39388.1 AAA family ATPase [Roseiflexaceae bacterium]
MQRILITGISGVGKSTVTQELAQHGYTAVDADTEEFSEWVEVSDTLAAAPGSPVEADRDWVWREDRIEELLSRGGIELLFVSGCAANMGKFLSQFNHIILLTTPADLTVERLRSRTNNPYGKHPDEVARILSLKESVEPVLRRIAGHEIETSAPLANVVSQILQFVQA